MSLEFNNEHINMKALQQRAFNLRWATLPADVIPLTAADPDFQSAPEIAAAMNDYINERVFSYGPVEGLPSFKKVIAETLALKRNFITTPELVLPVDSAAQGMMVAASYVLRPGDEAIVFDPVDFLFKTTVEAAGGKAVLFSIDAQTGTLNMDLLASLVTEKTRLLCLCNPHNPIGKVFTRAELQGLGDFAVSNNLMILSDEIWSDIVYAPHEYISIATISPQIAARTITVYGFSKSFGLAGLRVGYIVSPNAAVHEGLVLASLVRTTITGVSTVSQIAAQAAYEKCWYWVDRFVEHLTKMRDYTAERLNAMKNVNCTAPQGCYIIFPDISQTGRTAEEITDYLLNEARVAVVPGAAKWFGPGATGHIRLCFSTSQSILERALDRMEAAFKKL
ncbi:pyridoxal phosphate-dependent aminotransferase [Segetibacter sp. 3557_3]|uniref:pyridoxal phosphate-dependent aminotransferase n=1 Tax=Segetibacter sp. 3557_3 TaxID=2547429 RepID=UPI001058DA43|nr:pyridoxal phosphate-dependent aminotransferase [Segetibacter sp. 3557_3]TDH27734.1 pyridoxal phosphate-dependent aminotransferase [Segetibacter sp. 3557_3]